MQRTILSAAALAIIISYVRSKLPLVVGGCLFVLCTGCCVAMGATAGVVEQFRPPAERTAGTIRRIETQTARATQTASAPTRTPRPGNADSVAPFLIEATVRPAQHRVNQPATFSFEIQNLDSSHIDGVVIGIDGPLNGFQFDGCVPRCDYEGGDGALPKELRYSTRVASRQTVVLTLNAIPLETGRHELRFRFYDINRRDLGGTRSNSTVITRLLTVIG